ncbi:hypothetical protein HYDPIDRAFT_119723 [Hydnomerulius pinastri MD-312]|uniref:Uncharacterized protein n=1 Tax=Hydnomerulius pinastri MD-312 TaxID=994086 RepID=A0A0C9VL21_9AGAM|nr:hypothetical protein HYDPIDRAFT_119723 [Hydnomerulius pinastri MD-312]
MKPSHIARTTGINARTIRRIMELWWKTGSVQRTPIERGREERLDALDIAVHPMLVFLAKTESLHLVLYISFSRAVLNKLQTHL